MKSSGQSMILIFLFCLFAGGLYAQSSQPPNILFIFDASGSMWGKLGNRTKIQVAKETMIKLVQKTGEQSKLGLIVYGHKSTNACTDIETLVPLSPVNKSQFIEKVNALNPKGKTPIALSIKHALAHIKTIREQVILVLVSDGLETCEGNACELVQQAKKEGIKITMHVVGFGIEEKDLSPLECVVQAGGGQYFPANNAEELLAALEKSTEAVPAGNAFLSIKTTLDGNLKDAYIKVFKEGQIKEFMIGRTYENKQTNPRIMQLPAGLYSLEVNPVSIKSYPPLKFSGLKLSDNDTLRQEIEFTRGTVNLLVTRNGALSDATIQIFASGSQIPIATNRSYTKSENNPVNIQIPPGRYDVVISSVEISGRPEIKWTGKELGNQGDLKLSYDFLSGQLNIGAKQGATLIDATINIIDLKSGKSVGAGRTYQSSATNPKTFILEPGNYKIELNPVKPSGLARKSATVEVFAKKTSSTTLTW